MIGIAHLIGRQFAITAPCAVALACTPKPASITITGPITCREGTTVQVSAQVKDGKGRVLPLPIAWTLDPPAAGKLERTNLACLAEGVLSVRATAGVSATHKISIASPLIGTWIRRSDHYAGMRLRISCCD